MRSFGTGRWELKIWPCLQCMWDIRAELSSKWLVCEHLNSGKMLVSDGRKLDQASLSVDIQ